MSAASNEERRAAPRFQVVDYIAADVLIEDPAALEPRLVPVFLRDVSKSGIGFFIPLDIGLQPGSALTVKFGQHASPLRVRWMQRSDDDQWIECGAAFIETVPEVLPWLEDAFGGDVALTSHQSRIDGLALLFGTPEPEQ